MCFCFRPGSLAGCLGRGVRRLCSALRLGLGLLFACPHAILGLLSWVVLVLPSSVLSVVSGAAVVGFSGSRSVVPVVFPAVVAAVAPGASVLVGCARGVDAAARAAFPGARVFSVSSFGSGRGAFAARSVAFVRALSSAGGVLLSFPSSACPVGLVPSASSSRCFCGAGSGSWASLAFAVGLGVPCVVFAPFGVPAGWGFSSCGGGWFSFVPVPAPVQLSLF